jgi:hypothetical protein
LIIGSSLLSFSKVLTETGAILTPDSKNFLQWQPDFSLGWQ